MWTDFPISSFTQCVFLILSEFASNFLNFKLHLIFKPLIILISKNQFYQKNALCHKLNYKCDLEREISAHQNQDLPQLEFEQSLNCINLLI